MQTSENKPPRPTHTCAVMVCVTAFYFGNTCVRLIPVIRSLSRTHAQRDGFVYPALYDERARIEQSFRVSSPCSNSPLVSQPISLSLKIKPFFSSFLSPIIPMRCPRRKAMRLRRWMRKEAMQSWAVSFEEDILGQLKLSNQ